MWYASSFRKGKNSNSKGKILNRHGIVPFLPSCSTLIANEAVIIIFPSLIYLIIYSSVYLYLLFRFFLLHCLILAFLCTAEIDFIHSTHFLYRFHTSTMAQIFILFLISIPTWTLWCVTVTEYDVQLFKLKRIKFIWC